MRISDWSSDVCSSDLAGEHLGDVERLRKKALNLARARNRQLILFRQFVHAENGDDVLQALVLLQDRLDGTRGLVRSEEHTSELQSLMRISYAVFCLKKKKKHTQRNTTYQ